MAQTPYTQTYQIVHPTDSLQFFTQKSELNTNKKQLKCLSVKLDEVDGTLDPKLC
jgi:hypothetical protein